MCALLGVDEETKGWRLLDPQVMKVRISRNVHFLENMTWREWAVDGKGGQVGVLTPESILTLLPTLPQTEPQIVTSHMSG